MGLRVFIADDEPLTRMDLREMLEEEGYEVVGEAGDGFDAVEGCKKLDPDIVLMDIKMPLLNGIKAAEILKREGFTGCIIMFTAYNDSSFIDGASKNGVMGYFVKPIDERTFIPNLKILYSRKLELKNSASEVVKIKEKLEERKKVEKAKGIIMNMKEISESEAYEYLRKLSMDKRVSLSKIADIVIMSEGTVC